MVLTSSNLVKFCIWETLKRNFHIRLEEVGPRPYVISISTISFRCGKSLQLQLLRHLLIRCLHFIDEIVPILICQYRTDIDLPMSTTVAVAVLCNRYFVSISYRYHFTIMMHHNHWDVISHKCCLILMLSYLSVTVVSISICLHQIGNYK